MNAEIPKRVGGAACPCVRPAVSGSRGKGSSRASAQCGARTLLRKGENQSISLRIEAENLGRITYAIETSTDRRQTWSGARRCSSETGIPAACAGCAEAGSKRITSNRSKITSRCGTTCQTGSRFAFRATRKQTPSAGLSTGTAASRSVQAKRLAQDVLPLEPAKPEPEQVGLLERSEASTPTKCVP